MDEKKLKYKQLLKEFPNCPPTSFVQVERQAFRWAHATICSNDFLPMNIISDPSPRILDDNDLMCMGYGLSMFDTKENALSRYKWVYEKLREHQQFQFVDDKGDSIALVELIKEDGLADDPNKYGHFTFHEFDAVDLSKRVKYIYNIFDGNGKFIN